MNRGPAPLITLLAFVLLTTSCGGDPPPPTQIVQFQSNATTIDRGDTAAGRYESATSFVVTTLASAAGSSDVFVARIDALGAW